jgi:hypothetical protein
MRCRLIRNEKELMMRLKNGILAVGGIEFKVEGVSVSDNVNKQIFDVLEEILFIARTTYKKMWSREQTREALRNSYGELLRQGNPFCSLAWDLSRWTDGLAPYWRENLEGLTHDLKGDDIPWYVGDDEEETTERPGADEIREKISDLLIIPRGDVPLISISRHILSSQEEGCWVEQNPHLLGTYAGSFDRCLVIGLPTQRYSEFAWFDSGYGCIDEDELEVLNEFLALMMAISRHWGPLSVGKMEEEVSQMAMIAWQDLADRWHEGPVGALVEDYLRGGPTRKAASQAARIPHRI